MWLSQLEHLENEYIIAWTDMVGHNVCDNVVDLPDVLEIPGVGVFPVVPNPSFTLQNGVWFIWLYLFLTVTMEFFHLFCKVKQDGNRCHWTVHVIPNFTMIHSTYLLFAILQNNSFFNANLIHLSTYKFQQRDLHCTHLQLVEKQPSLIVECFAHSLCLRSLCEMWITSVFSAGFPFWN